MGKIILKNVTKQFDKSSKAVDNLDLEISDGDFITLLGPSGCGKTTTLRMIAGLETPTTGEIWFDEKLMFSAKEGIDVSPDKRNIGFLFQNYALWPHMTVRNNIGFGLKNLKQSNEEIKKRVDELLEIMKIEELGDRYPSELSGGQQQRVAIARTLANRPSILLMDEPLSNLDAKLRLDMRAELKKLHKETGATFIYVTHDQQEAMSLSTKICLLKNGLLQQCCPPLEMYMFPKNSFVADFLGSPSINLVKFKMETNAVLHNQELKLLFTPKNSNFIASEKKVFLGIRPEMISITQENGIEAEVESALPYGSETTLTINIGKIKLRMLVFGCVDFPMGAKIKIDFLSDQVCLFDESGEFMSHGSLKIVNY